MNTLIQHAQLIIRMKNCGLHSNLIKKFPIQEISDSCDRIEKSDLKHFNYSEYYLIQEELIRDKDIIKPLQLAFKGKYDIDTFEKFLAEIKDHEEKMSDYDYRDIIKVLNNKQLKVEAYYHFLKYFIKEQSEAKKRVINNLNYFYLQDRVNFNEITENEINLLKNYYLDNTNLIPKENIKEVYELLSNNKDLSAVIDYLYSNKLYLPLSLNMYKLISNNAKAIVIYIKEIDSKLQNKEILYQLLLKWLGNGCSLYDLKIINSKIDDMDNYKLETIIQNNTSYINFIYGNKLKKFPLDSIYGKKEDLIIYAIRENKNSFLKLIENNMDEFLSIPINSVLYHEKFYTHYINLNEITLKNLIDLKSMIYEAFSRLDSLKDQIFTFAEISTLYGADKKYILLYNDLLDLKIDKRMIIIRQLLKKDLLNIEIDEYELHTLADKLKEKPLYTWLEKDFNEIKSITASDIVGILTRYEKIEKFIGEIKNRNELRYIIRNCNNLEKYNSLQEIKNNIEDIDEYWTKLKTIMNFSDDFINVYKKNITDFLLNNNAELAYEYYSSQNIEQQKAFKLIIKAEIMGEFKKLKYHSDDLEKEIDYKLEEHQVVEWSEKNTELNESNYNIREYDDFYHTMILGEYPKRTCINYKGGAYNKCLLACFDSNKKILYAKVNDKIVARAMVRLTKGSYTRVKNTLKSLAFVDVENETENEKDEEKLTLFLERPYISGISKKEEIIVKKLFVKLLERKSQKMDALLVLSNDYYEIEDNQFISMPYYMYISKSKSSSQYLDSLSGEAKVSDVGEYKQNNFLIWKNKENESTNALNMTFVA